MFLFSYKIESLERVRSLEIIDYDLNTLYFALVWQTLDRENYFHLILNFLAV